MQNNIKNKTKTKRGKGKASLLLAKREELEKNGGSPEEVLTFFSQKATQNK